MFAVSFRRCSTLLLGGMIISSPFALSQDNKDKDKGNPASPPAKTESVVKDKAPATPQQPAPSAAADKAPSTPQSPMANPAKDNPAANKTPASSNDKADAAEKAPAKDKNPATDKTPATEKSPASDRTPANDRNPSRDPSLPGLGTDRTPGTDASQNRDSRDANRNDNNQPGRANPPAGTTDANRDDRRFSVDPGNRDDRRDNRQDSRDNRRDDRTDRRDARVSATVQNRAFSRLGVQVDVAARGNGLSISTVQPNSVFATAGFRTNDVLLRVGDRRFTDTVVFYDWLATVQPNQRIAFVVLRDGREETLYWTPTEQWITEYKTIIQEVPAATGGLGIILDQQQNAAIVADVEPNSPADRAGIQRRDEIISVNNDKIRNPQDFQAATAKLDANANAEFGVVRFLSVQPGTGPAVTTQSTVERRDTLVAPANNVTPAPPAPAANVTLPTPDSRAVPAPQPAPTRPGILGRPRAR